MSKPTRTSADLPDRECRLRVEHCICNEHASSKAQHAAEERVVAVAVAPIAIHVRRRLHDDNLRRLLLLIYDVGLLLVTWVRHAMWIRGGRGACCCDVLHRLGHRKWDLHRQANKELCATLHAPGHHHFHHAGVRLDLDFGAFGDTWRSYYADEACRVALRGRHDRSCNRSSVHRIIYCISPTLALPSKNALAAWLTLG